MAILQSVSNWWNDNKDVVITAAATVLVCAVADRACRTEAGRTALNGALVAGGTALAKNLAKKFDEVEINDDEVVVSKEEFELTKKELELAKRREKLRRDEEALAKSAKSNSSASVTDEDVEAYVNSL